MAHREHVAFVDGKYQSLHEHGGRLSESAGTIDAATESAVETVVNAPPIEPTLDEKIAFVKEQLSENDAEYDRLSDLLMELRSQKIDTETATKPGSEIEAVPDSGTSPITGAAE